MSTGRHELTDIPYHVEVLFPEIVFFTVCPNPVGKYY